MPFYVSYKICIVSKLRTRREMNETAATVDLIYPVVQALSALAADNTRVRVSRHFAEKKKTAAD